MSTAPTTQPAVPLTPAVAASAGTSRALSSLGIVINGVLHIPPGITDLATFRAWVRSDAAPEKLRVSYLAGTIWVDLTMEQAYFHNSVKTEIASVLFPLVRARNLSRFFSDGMLLSNPAVDLSTIPDGFLVSYEAIQSGRVRHVPGKHGGAIEMEGTPDMVLEVVSDSSVEKDMVILPRQYYQAGVTELWRVDARGELRFEILQRTDAGYVPTLGADGWWSSAVFGQSFQLDQQIDQLGLPEFRLAVRL